MSHQLYMVCSTPQCHKFRRETYETAYQLSHFGHHPTTHLCHVDKMQLSREPLAGCFVSPDPPWGGIPLIL
ncbi:hypothetical protein FR483_n544R [Paramecium bursaria Chlorella virus FR483]|uniref:Uncharacterized protein n544R n=1 Tax=Paramecium bursaria Chlorella virus FR483 TaxID=399781 RepID=A7J7P8_PBCVF|nr:hypothetical protein FR483_n544R [Paramecium bursaria Chlorella virus FR483]ABT15829.1 hypothetical protein FR483_n544R [Paramecium bursaria Chlorella virus FR483]